MKKKDPCENLGMDQACLNINSTIEAIFSKQYDECVQCPFIDHKNVSLFPMENNFVIETEYPAKFFIEAGESSCLISRHLREYGKYNLSVNVNASCNVTESTNCLTCELTAETLPSAVTTYIPIIVAVCIYFGLALFYTFGEALYRLLRRQTGDDSFENVNSSPRHSSTTTLDHRSCSLTQEPVVPPQTRKRLRSLDTFRGISLAIMIFVNYGGGKYWFFHHARWNGLTVGDLVFPWFIWIMGVSMSMSLRSLVKRSTPKMKVVWKIFKRTVILFALGIILNTSYGATDMTKLRIPGVLQRFAISYFVVGIVHLFFARPADSHTEARWSGLRDIYLYWGEWLIMLTILAVHLCLTFLLPVKGCPTGYLGPGGLHEGSKYPNCTGGAAGQIDRVFFGYDHIYSKPTCKKLYDTSEPYDPEGLLGSLTSILLVYLGLQAGKILQTYGSPRGKLVRWLAWGTVLGVLAAILCKGSQNDGWIPVNKNLWSLSFILTTGCMAFFLFSFCFYVQDVQEWWTGAPFFYPGMNSILVYIGHQLTSDLFPWQFQAPNTHAAQLAMDLWGTSLWVFISYVLYTKKVFLAI